MYTTLAILAACSPKLPPDTGATDTGTADTADTADTGAPPSGFAFGGVLTAPADIEVPSGEIRISVVYTVLADTAPSSGDIVVSTTASGLTAGGSVPFTLYLPESPDDALFYQPDPDQSDFEIATFLVAAWQDADGDGAPGAADLYVGGSLTFLVFARGTIPPDLTDLGGAAGWNLLYFDFSTGDDGPSAAEPIESGYDSFPLEANLLPPVRTDLPGTITPSLGGTVQVDLYSALATQGWGNPAQPTLDTVQVDASAEGASFSFPWPLPEPPDDHLVSDFGGEYLDALAGFYLAVAYQDSDGSGGWTIHHEQPLALTTTDGPDARMLLYLRPTGFMAAFFPEAMSVRMGWTLLGSAGTDIVPIDWSKGLVLEAP